MLPLAELILAIPAFSMVFARICGTMLFMPGLGEASAPVTARIGLAISFTILMAPFLPRDLHLENHTGLRFSLMLLVEIITGLWFGWMVRLVVNALGVAGQVIGYMIGLSSVLQPDAELGSQSNALGTVFSLAAPLIFLSTGLYYYPLRGLVGLFELIPPGHLAPIADTAEQIVNAVATAFDLALQVASPFVLFGVLWQFITGFIARTAARMQVYFISTPGQILAGFTLFCVTAHLMFRAWYQGAEAQLHVLAGSG